MLILFDWDGFTAHIHIKKIVTDHLCGNRQSWEKAMKKANIHGTDAPETHYEDM